MIAHALRRPITIVVLALAMLLAALGAVRTIPRDILPTLGVPTIYVCQPYAGMSPAQMEGFLTYYYEYHFLYIAGIEHVESRSIQGAALIKLQFHPGTDMAGAMAETIGYVNRARAFMPPGTVPPFVTRFDVGSVPVGDLVFSSPTRSVGEIQDAALNRVRPLFATLPGVSAPPPFGGNARSLVIEVDPQRLRAHGLTPELIVNAVATANQVVPAGNLRVGGFMPIVPTNSVVTGADDLRTLPIASGVLLRDVARVEDTADTPTSYALVNGRRAVYIPVTKRSGASTLSVVDRVRANLPAFKAVLPDDVSVSYEMDQSVFVRRALSSLSQEALLGAGLAGLMIWLFLRDWRSSLIVVVSIPLALAGAILALWLLGFSLNLMTLGGLALAVGLLVDEATVTIENVHAHQARGTPLRRAVLESGQEVALPILVSMLCILAVFVPSFFMQGAARALFVPLSVAVGLAMICSYLLSRTLVPILCCWLLKRGPELGHSSPSLYASVCGHLVALRWPLLLLYVALAGGVLGWLGPHLPQEIFPASNEPQFQLRLRASVGTRLERTEELTKQVLSLVGSLTPVSTSIAFVGTHPASYPINNIYLWNSGPHEALLRFALQGHPNVARLQEQLRQRLAQQLPQLECSFEPVDLVSRVLSFGSDTPIRIDVFGPSLPASRSYSERVKTELQKLSWLRDLHTVQSLDYPSLEVQIDRQRAFDLGTTAAEISRSLLVATSSSRFYAANYWADAKSGIAYQVQVQVPVDAWDKGEDLLNLPVSAKTLLRNLATLQSTETAGQLDRYNMQRTVSLGANLSGMDLGSASRALNRVIQGMGPPPDKVHLAMRGQIPALSELLSGLSDGLAISVLAIGLILAANFQSWRLALIVILTVPGTLTGVLLALWFSSASLNVQSFTGAVMAVGVGVANSILLVTFCERYRLQGHGSAEAAVLGARSRLRPILMTSLAMLLGMLPLALGLGDAGKQSASLGISVFGGLLLATLTTLFVVPAIFAVVQSRTSTLSASLHPDDEA